MPDWRLSAHPILQIPSRVPIPIYWCGQELASYEGETIASALFASGIRVFGHHHRDGAPLGIFCANGQCAQCTVLADGRAVKACIHPVRSGMKIEPLNALPVLPPVVSSHPLTPIREIKIPVLILGGGPSGLSAAVELGRLGVQTILVDDKARLGGKLVLQTHRFFGSINAVYAGTRGVEIASILEKDVAALPSVDLWTGSTCLAVFSDKKVGILRHGNEYVLVAPDILLVATGAREKSLTFKGNTLPGVYGAGAFQTILNRDLIKPADRLFIIGGGNVGLIAGYHALQADIQVVGLVEAAQECGGYRVHKDKLTRMGVPIYTGHTVVSANGDEMVQSVTIARVDDHFRQIHGTERTFACDTILVAVGLDPVNEFFIKAKDFGFTVLAAGDAEEIAEASAAIYSGKIRGLEIASLLGCKTDPIPASWRQLVSILKSKPGKDQTEIIPEEQEGVVPVIHCSQEIPCDPCSSICPQGLIYIDKSDIRHVPAFLGNNYCCSGCTKCVSICPGLAITLVNYQINPEQPLVTLPYEFHYGKLHTGDRVTVTDTSGLELGEVEVEEVKAASSVNRTAIIRVMAPASIARKIAGIRVQEIQASQPMDHYVERISDDTIVCRCERVTAGEIRDLIRKGYRDLNEIKTVTRAMMGACGSKTCGSLIHRLFLDEGVDPSKIMAQTRRPIFMEVPLGTFAGVKLDGEGKAMNNYDVIIIGSGSIGTPAACFLSKSGLKVLVVDSAASVGQGSNKKAIGGIRATHSDPTKIHLCQRSIEIFSTWCETTGDDIEWFEGGYCFVAYRQREEETLKDLVAYQKKMGLQVEWLDKQQTLELVPDFNPVELLGASYSPRDGNASPLLAIHSFYTQAVKNGAVFVFNEPVIQILHEHGRVTGLRTPLNKYFAPVIINAAGAWAKPVAALLGVDVPVTPDSHESAITEPVARFLRPMVVDIRPSPGSSNYYFYQHITGQLIFCITPNPSIWGDNAQETSDFLPLVARRMVDLMPRLTNLRVRRTWRGLYPMTPDGIPIVGWNQEYEGFLLAAGMCGQGFMLGPSVGELLTRMVLKSLQFGDESILADLSPYRTFSGMEKLK